MGLGKGNLFKGSMPAAFNASRSRVQLPAAFNADN